MDRFLDPSGATEVLKEFPIRSPFQRCQVTVFPDLLTTVEGVLYEKMVPLTIHLPYQEGQLISLFHENGQVEKVEHGRKGVKIQGAIPGYLLARFQAYLKTTPSGEEPEEENENEDLQTNA